MPFLGSHLDDRGKLIATNAGLESALRSTQDEYLPTGVSGSIAPTYPTTGTGKQTCANPDCSGRWKMPWKNRRRPIFESHWGCSTKCLEAIIRRSLRRERGDLRPLSGEGAPHRHRIPLGLMLLEQGSITQSQLRRALDAQRCAGQGRIGDWLVQECGVSSSLITRGLATQWSCPVLPMDGFAPAAMALTLPRLFVEELRLLPLRVAGSRILYLAFNDNLDASAAFAIEQMSGLRVESGLLEDQQFESARGRLLESDFVTVKQRLYLDADALAARIAAVLEDTEPIGSRLVRVHQHYWLRTWLESGAYSGIGNMPASGEDVADFIFTPDLAS